LSPGTVEISDAQPDLGWPISRMQLRLLSWSQSCKSHLTVCKPPGGVGFARTKFEEDP
jgi:hypothetical protein